MTYVVDMICQKAYKLILMSILNYYQVPEYITPTQEKSLLSETYGFTVRLKNVLTN
jgi:hypothetical protein